MLTKYVRCVRVETPNWIAEFNVEPRPRLIAALLLSGTHMGIRVDDANVVSINDTHQEGVDTSLEKNPNEFRGQRIACASHLQPEP